MLRVSQVIWRLCAAGFLFYLVYSGSALALYDDLTEKVQQLETGLNGTIGIAILDERGQEIWHYNGTRRFPLTSTFKTLLCAKLLWDSEKNFLNLSSETVIKKENLVIWSPITETMVGQRISLKSACSAAMTMSDNTAANIVLKDIGGPEALTRFLRTIGDSETRLDRYEPFLNEAARGDQRDTTTPLAIAQTLKNLVVGDTLSKSSKRQLQDWMNKNQVAGSLIRATLPVGWTIADRSGAGGSGSRAITAVVWPEPTRPIVIAIYITGTSASLEERSAAIARIGEMIFAKVNQ